MDIGEKTNAFFEGRGEEKKRLNAETGKFSFRPVPLKKETGEEGGKRKSSLKEKKKKKRGGPFSVGGRGVRA